MTQRVPPFSFGEETLRVRQFLYEYWCERGHGPNLRAIHEATGLARRQILAALRELDLGTTCVIDHETVNGALLKLQPFSSFPTSVEVHLDGRFHAFAGCAMESIALPRMPPFAGKEVLLESCCACCLEPVRLRLRDDAILSREPAGVRIHVALPPSEWNKTNITSMCDAMSFVHDAGHALAFEKEVGRRGVLFTLEQAARFVADTAAHRMHRYDWPPVSVDPDRILAGIRALGVDVSPWGL